MSDPNQFYRPDLVSGLNWAAPDIKPIQLAQAGQKPATKQQAATNPQGGVDVRKLGENLGAALLRLSRPPQLGQAPQQGVAGQPGPIATPPAPGPIVPQQLRPQQSTVPDAYYPNVTGSMY